MNESPTGHRQRLRQRFRSSESVNLTEAELLELLLTFAIPRRDVAPVARRLLEQCGSLPAVLAAARPELMKVLGVGEQAATLIQLITRLASRASSASQQPREQATQPMLVEVAPDMGPLFSPALAPEEPPMRTFANDEIANVITFIPQAAQCESYEAFKAHLNARLPYNSASTRHRRANYILNRFFPHERLDTPLTYYTAHCTTARDLKPVLFYHVLQAEPLAAKVAEEFIWPALPTGYVERESMREFILRYLPDISVSSQNNALRSLFNTYTLLDIATVDDTTLRFQTHTATLEAFLYVLTNECPQPGIYDFATWEQGAMRRWLLWDREWMRRQLYNLRDLGVITKVSEIDTMCQFTLPMPPAMALHHYFAHPKRDTLALREK